MKSPLTSSTNIEILYQQQTLPLFQNKVYNNAEQAINAETANVVLAQCLDSGFIFSGEFDIDRLNYDENYQNEQSNSAFFQAHLSEVIQLLQKHNTLGGKVLEIGCGKGFFMDMLKEQGVDISGIDPTYEGDSELIIKDYYSKHYFYLNADLIILRHTLEHIPDPLGFVQMIAESNGYKGKIYIEIPTFEWISEHAAIEDVFYEHCNYFTKNTAHLLFDDAIIEHTFNGQYLSILADLNAVKKHVVEVQPIEKFNLSFDQTLERYQNLLKEHPNVAIWGAGAKGSTFLNILDKDKSLVKAVIDINPKKQHKFIGGTGHPIIPPSQINEFGIQHILIMNPNYSSEIKRMVNDENITFSFLI